MEAARQRSACCRTIPTSCGASRPSCRPRARSGRRTSPGIVRSLLPVMERAGIATREEVDIETLEVRLAAELVEHRAVVAPPTLVGAWARHRLTH